jgi:uncharacterized protein (DUF433 family)
MQPNQYIEVRNGGYYVAGSRIGLDVVVRDFRNGRSADAIFEAYPAIGSLAKVYGVITFVLEHPAEIDAYLEDQKRLFRELQVNSPLPLEMAEPFERLRRENAAKPA